MESKNFRNYTSHTLVGDFETTVYEGQTETEVWASALVEMGSEDVAIYHSIDETFEALRELDGNLIVYYHNRHSGSLRISFPVSYVWCRNFFRLIRPRMVTASGCQ